MPSYWAHSIHFGALDPQTLGGRCSTGCFSSSVAYSPYLCSRDNLGILKWEASSSLGRPFPLLTTYASCSTHIYAPSGFLRVAACSLFSCTATHLSEKLISYHTKCSWFQQLSFPTHRQIKAKISNLLQLEKANRRHTLASQNILVSCHCWYYYVTNAHFKTIASLKKD